MDVFLVKALKMIFWNQLLTLNNNKKTLFFTYVKTVWMYSHKRGLFVFSLQIGWKSQILLEK